MEMTTPQREHRWLERFIGEWTSETEMSMEPGKPAEKCHGTDTVRSLGGLWILAEGQGEMPGGGPVSMVLTLGYDPQRKRFVSTWIGSMMTHLWVRGLPRRGGPGAHARDRGPEHGRARSRRSRGTVTSWNSRAMTTGC